MRYILYNEQYIKQGTFTSVESLRNFLCDLRYEKECSIKIDDTFDYIRSIKWFFDIEE